MGERDAELKVCELCGRLFVRESHPGVWNDRLQRTIEIPRSPDCPDCQANPPVEDEKVVTISYRSYRVVGVKF
jgi:hypothetical protein